MMEVAFVSEDEKGTQNVCTLWPDAPGVAIAAIPFGRDGDRVQAAGFIGAPPGNARR